jgi:hypothetical protein
MPQISSELNAQYWEPFAAGPVAQTDISAWAGLPPPPATIVASGNYTSLLIVADGFKALACGVTSTQAGALSIQRYIDKAGLIAQGPAISSTLVAATPNIVNSNDGLPFQTFKVIITNTGGATATISNFGLLLNAA